MLLVSAIHIDPLTASSTATEEGAVATFQLTLDKAPTSALTLNYVTAPGTASVSDYVSAAGTVTFAVGQTTAFVSITTSEDSTYEADETFTVSFSGSSLTDSVSVTGTITNDDVDTANLPQTLTLTTGVDSGSAFTGGSGVDVFNGTTGTTTLNALDSLDGGEGSDYLTYIQTGTISVASSTKVVNIETATVTSGADVTLDASAWTGLTSLTVASVGGSDISLVTGANVTVTDTNLAAALINVDGAANVTIDAAKVTTGQISVGTNTAVTGAVYVMSGLVAGAGASAITVVGGTSVSVAQTLKAGTTNTIGAVDITNDGTLTTVSATATKGTGATITYNTVDVNGLGSADDADTITSITASGYTTMTTANTNSLSTLSLGTGSGNITIDNGDAGAETTTLDLTVNGLTGGTLDDDDVYTTINITSTGTASTMANITDSALTNITLAGDKKLTLTSIAGATVLESVDASAATGGMTISSQLLTTTAFTGGSGVDTITLGATTQAIATGAGNDVVTLAAGTTALGTGGTVDAGDGTDDVLSFADADDATTASGGTTFETKISNFEVVNLAGAAGAGVTVNVANLDDLSKVNVAVDLGQTLAVSNIASGGTITYAAAQTAASTITVSNAASGTADVMSVGISSAAARNVNGLTISNVETINFLTDDTATTTTGIEHVASLTAAAAATAVTVAGDAGLTLTFTGTALTSFDASGVTDGDVTWTAGALAAAAAVKGGASADANVIVLSAALDDITYTGGSGTDTITMNNATNHDATTNSFTLGNGTNTLTAGNNDGDNTVTGGTGVDTITLGNGDNNVSTSSGNDIITVGTGANTIDAGAGNDTVTIGASAGTNSVDVGAGTDAIVFTGVQTAAGYYTSLTGMGAGDTLDFSATANDAGGLSTGVLGAKITLGGASSFANFLDAAAAGDGSTDSAFAWFQYNGNTYLVLDNSNDATFQDGGDQVIELVGLISLATSTQDGSYVVTLV